MASAAGGSASAAAGGASTATGAAASSKHALHTPWTYWELRKKWYRGQDWTQLPTTLFTVDSVEDFWACWSRVPKIT
jgi:hypothetical protein